jgi:hypothetical protein
MSNKTLTIDGITFPDFGGDDSKKNFRLVFYIGYKDANGKKKVTIVSKPDGGQWQWRKATKENFLPPTSIGDSVELATDVLDDAATKIAEIDGTLTSVTVQFLDVFDASAKSFLKGKVLPSVLTHLQGLGINPIDLIPIPGAFTTIIKDNVNVDDLAGKFKDFLTKKNEDKLLNSISQKYNDESSFVISGRKEWKKGKTGTYAVTIGVA